MRIPLPAGAPMNLRQFLLRCGYASHYQPLVNRLSFVRRLGGGAYPRYHLYVEKNQAGQDYLSLHLDQKRPSYRGVRAHSGEYDGPVVEREGGRLYQLLQSAVAPPMPSPEEKPAHSWWPWQRKGD